MKDHYGLDRADLDRWLTTEPDYDYEQHDIEEEIDDRIVITQSPRGWRVCPPFHEGFNRAAKQMGATWKEFDDNKYWIVPANKLDDLRALIRYWFHHEPKIEPLAQTW